MLLKQCFFLFLTLLVKIQSAHASISTNLANIRWAHAVNSLPFLKDVLQMDVNMIEGDILMGKVNNKEDIVPIMAHPPRKASDLSLQEFITVIQKYNKKAPPLDQKGIKLDFKTIEAFEAAVKLDEVVKMFNKPEFPVWVNADILQGPPSAGQNHPVDAKRFLSSIKNFPKVTLSLGWTTGIYNNIREVSYAYEQIDTMQSLVKEHHIKNNITYAVRAGIAAQSLDEMIELITMDQHTLTIWSPTGEQNIDLEKLREVIREIGINLIYIDVPDDLRGQLRLDALNLKSKSNLVLQK